MWSLFIQAYSESEMKLHDQPLTNNTLNFRVLEDKAECLFALDGSMLDSWYSVKTTHEEDTEEFN